MKKKISTLPILFFLSILSVLFYLLLIERNPSEVPSQLINKEIPNFKANYLLSEKKFISTKVFKKEVMLVNFFATWCKPCRDEHNFIKKLANYKEIKIIGINYKDNGQKAINWLKELGNPYNAVIEDKRGKIAIDWGVYGIPETFIVDSNGIIKYRHVGPINEKIYKKIISTINNLK
jgi:cytochrome c biogenesis protein CcmG, thiol:disulfide interchange protein DsbE